MSEPLKKTPWYYSVLSVILALVLFGPFAFPLLWKSPRFNLAWKILTTVTFTLLTIYLIVASWHLFVLMTALLKQAGGTV